MRLHTLIALTLALSAAGPLAAQNDGSRPRRGKIDGVERDKDKDRSNGGGSDDCGCGGLWWIDLGGDALDGLVHLFSPRGTGRGYLDYPYQGGEDQAPFLVSRTQHGRGFSNLSVTLFDDAGSSLAAGRVAYEGAAALAYGSLELAGYREPLATETDYLFTWRAGLGVLPRLGSTAMLRAGFAVRGLVLDDGSASEGPELELGAQILPRRPFGASVVGRLAAMSWNGGGSMFALRELNTTGSVFLGRVELQAGWHWMKVGGAPAFGGPTIGTRLWF